MKKISKKWAVVLSLAAMLMPAFSVASAQDDNRERVVLHKEAFFDIRVTENLEANKVAAEVAQFMKTHENVAITVIGYADRQTGNPALNVKYAAERAERFRNELIGRYGVDPACITVDSKGDRVQPFTKNDDNRCVIIDGYGYVPASPLDASSRADAQREKFRQDKQERYDAEMQRYRKDTVYVVRTDTLWMSEEDSLHPERPFGLNKAHNMRNWFITFAGGPGIFQGDHNVDAVYKDRLYPAFDISFGKWIYPALGLRVGVNLDMVHSYYNPWLPEQMVHHAEVYDKRPWLHRMHYNAWNFHGDVMFNVSSLIWKPYNRRIWNLIPYVGVGCIVTWDQPWFKYSPSLNVGVLNSFRVAEHVDINVDLRLKEFNDDFNYYTQGRSMEGITNLMIGLTWHISPRGF